MWIQGYVNNCLQSLLKESIPDPYVKLTTDQRKVSAIPLNLLQSTDTKLSRKNKHNALEQLSQ